MYGSPYLTFALLTLTAQLRDAPLHVNDCLQCNCHYETKDALEQHRRDSPRHEIEGHKRILQSGIVVKREEHSTRVAMSREQIVRKSFGSWPNFMASYGLKVWDDDDVRQGNAILDEMRRNNGSG